ncbi:MAG: FHA domain-containing protein [Planctomycetes bacterium]|nr:FHA domain-containing protein [Planctomycetota bacterium]
MMALQYYLLSSKDRILLDFDKHIFFGRGEGNNIVVDDIRASRRHAELYWDGSSFVIIDLNSSNGTTVNGNRISSCVLNDGDFIEIGLQSFKYRVVKDPTELETSFMKIQKDTRGMVTAEMPSLDSILPENDFNGSLSTMSVPELCQTVLLGRRSGLLRVMSDRKEKGLLYFREGEIKSAECGLRTGDEAAIMILHFSRGHFSFTSQAPALEPNVTTKTPQLLLEAARLKDEHI